MVINQGRNGNPVFRNVLPEILNVLNMSGLNKRLTIKQ